MMLLVLLCPPANLSPALGKSELEVFFYSKAIFTATIEKALELIQDTTQKSLGLGQPW